MLFSFLSVRLKILPVIKLQQVKSRYLPIVPLCVIFSMCWRLKHHYLVWLTRYHILDRNHCIENCSPFPKPQNNLTIFFYGKKKMKILVFFAYFWGLENPLSTYHCLRLDNYVSGRRGTVELWVSSSCQCPYGNKNSL